MEKVTTLFGSEILFESDAIVFTDENNCLQRIPFKDVKNVEDNMPVNPVLEVQEKTKLFNFVTIGAVILFGILSIYNFLNPEVVEKFGGGMRYIYTEESYVLAWLCLFITFFIILIIGIFNYAFNEELKKKKAEFIEDNENNKDWTLTIKATKNGSLVPFEVCKGHVSEISQIKEQIQSSIESLTFNSESLTNA